jgi:hypothetical protein
MAHCGELTTIRDALIVEGVHQLRVGYDSSVAVSGHSPRGIELSIASLERSESGELQTRCPS